MSGERGCLARLFMGLTGFAVLGLLGGYLAKQYGWPPLSGPPENRYDRLIRQMAATYLPPEFEWQMFKALVRQESDFDPKAVSKSGAIGLGQIMPETGKDLGVSPRQLTDPATNLDAAARYLRQIWNSWEDQAVVLPVHTRLRFTLAGYNAGPNRVRRAWEQAGRPNDWTQLAPHLPDETQTYVRRIVDEWYPRYRHQTAVDLVVPSIDTVAARR